MERSKARAYIFPATILQIDTFCPTEAGELSGSDPGVGTSSEISCIPFMNDSSDRSDWTDGKRPKKEDAKATLSSDLQDFTVSYLQVGCNS